MGLPVLTTVTGAPWEAELVSALDAADHGLTVVRRCVDLAELLSVAATGTARAVLLSPDLRHLDREAVARLAAGGVAVVGVVAAGDHVAEQRLISLGVSRVACADAGPAVIAAAAQAAVAEVRQAAEAVRRRADLGDPGAALSDVRLLGPVGESAPGDPSDPTAPRDPPAPVDLDAGPEREPGALVAVWGPTGAPGRTTVAVGIADEAARAGVSTLLIDADVYGGVVAQVLGLLDESPGLTAATRLAATGTLDGAALARLAWSLSPSLRVLGGIARADRWPELRPSAWEVVLTRARELADLVVLDCGFCLEQDEELAYDTLAPRRNGITVSALGAADTIVVVSGADPVSLHRTVRALDELSGTVADAHVQVVVNRVRRGVVPGRPEREIAAALRRFAGVDVAAFLPQDVAAADAALAAGRTLGDVAPKSPLRTALRDLAAQLVGADPVHRARRPVRPTLIRARRR